MSTLNDEIVDVFSLVGLLLVFVFAYFSGIWQQVESEMTKRKVGDNVILEERKGQLRRYLWLMMGLDVVIVLIVALLAPLFIQVLDKVRWGAPFDAVRAGLTLVIVFLIGLGICVVIICKRINKKVNEIDGWIAQNRR